MSKEKKIVKFRTRREVNIGLVIASGLLILMLIQIYRYFTNPHLSVYEVKEGSSGGTVTVDAMILRKEQVVKTTQAGYLNFYFREGKRASKGAKIYSINESESLNDYLNINEDELVLSKSDITHLKSDVRGFFSGFSDSQFADTSELHEKLLSDYLRYRDLSLVESLQMSGQENRSGFVDVMSEKSGTISFYSDCYDGYTTEMLTGEEFQAEKKAIPEQIRKKGIQASESFAYKLVYEDDWELVFPIEEPYLSDLLLKNTVTFTLPNHEESITKPFTVLNKNGKKYLCVSMNRYCNEFLSVRFIELTISSSSTQGLKIPNSAILEKELYQIPERFVMKGGGGDTMGLNLEVFDEKTGAVRPDFNAIEPLFSENGYYFFAADALSSDRYLYAGGEDKEPERAMLYSFLTKTEGVYNMNKGYAVFRRIKRITDIDQYVLVEDGVPGGIALYDHIVLDIKAVTKDVILVEGDD